MGSTRPLRELYKVSERFRRSVNVAADFGHDDALDGYVITSLSKAILLRISAGLAGEARSRAWSITGPYGAGKSACGLFVAKQLAYPVNSAARMELRGKDVRLCQDLLEYVPGLQDGGFAVVPVVGSRHPDVACRTHRYSPFYQLAKRDASRAHGVAARALSCRED